MHTYNVVLGYINKTSTVLLFSFELCRPRACPATGMPGAQGLAIFFWIMLYGALFKLYNALQTLSCYFLLNYADPSEFLRLASSPVSNLLFSFELCKRIAETIVGVSYPEACYFLLNFGRVVFHRQGSCGCD